MILQKNPAPIKGAGKDEHIINKKSITILPLHTKAL